MKKALYIIALLVAFMACKNEIEIPPVSMLKATIKNSDKKNTTIPTISVYAPGVDSLWITKDSTNTVLIPLKADSITDYVFRINGISDTLRFIADSKIVYESMESGFYYDYELEDVLHTTYRIDSILIKNTSITKDWNENILIYINSLPVPTN